MKTCTKCARELPLAYFYKRIRGKNIGRESSCKRCKSERNAEYKNRPDIAQREQDRNLKLRQARSDLEYNRRYRRANLLRTRAHKFIALMVKNGLIHVESCEVCNEEKTDAHHDDYSKPEEIRWLCRKCHAKHHRDLRNAER